MTLFFKILNSFEFVNGSYTALYSLQSIHKIVTDNIDTIILDMWSRHTVKTKTLLTEVCFYLLHHQGNGASSRGEDPVWVS